MKKIYTILIVLFLTTSVFAQKMEKIVFGGPFTAVSYPLIVMVENHSMSAFAEKSEFKYWQNPDQLRAMIMGKQVDLVAAPSYVGATFFNKGVPLKILNISVWGILHMISTDPDIKTFADLKGKKIVVPFREEMPDIVFRRLAKANGIDIKKDYELTYVAHPMDVAQLLLSGRFEHALTAEPAATITIMKSKKFHKKGKAKLIYKVIDIQEKWGKAFNTEPRIPQAGTLALPSVVNNIDLLTTFNKEFERSVDWILANPQKAAVVISKYLPQLKKEMIVAGILNSDLKSVSAQDAMAETQAFYKVLFDFAPKKVGGKLPDENLFYK